MATVVAPKPSAPHQTKMKRPPLPTVQTNGVRSSHSSRSPTMSSKRPPGSKQAPTPTLNGGNGDANGLGPRLSNRRKDSQKPGDIQGRPSRSGRGGQEGERKVVKRMTEPYVKTQSYILKRHRNKPPSLIIHLHPTNFRFDTQDGSFSYNSPMKFVLEHLKSQTIPHDMIEELTAAGTRFYEGCLIVQVQDHRSKSGPPSGSANSGQDGNNVPSSIHNYSQYLTPSPYRPYPQKPNRNATRDAGNGSVDQGESSEPKDKESSKPNIFHVVLFPTPLSIHEEVVIQANTVDPRSNSRKQSTAVPRTPASATIPPIPSSAIPPTPSAPGPPAKKQKMSISGNEIHAFESKIIQTTAPPLFLDPVEDIVDAHKVLETLTDPEHKESYPAPKVKKRTVAELAADEAIAAHDEDFMLIMNDRSASGPAGAKAGPTDGESGIPTFTTNFQHLQFIKNYQAEQKQRAIHEAEAKALREAAAQANKLRHEQHERANKQEIERRAAQIAQDQAQTINIARQTQMHREMQAREMQRQAQLAHSHGHPIPNGVSRAQNSSPAIGNATPNANSSPLVGNVPMNVTSSGQGVTSSPARPPSTMQHGQPGGTGMARQVSRPQGPSRTGTPQMNGTPAMPQATPVLGQSATPRVSQGSPPIGATPAMNHNVLANQHINGRPPHFSPDQQQHNIEQLRMQQMIAQRQKQAQQMQQLAAQQRMQNASPNSMSPEQRQSAHMQNLQHQAALNQQRQTTQDYQQSLRMHHAAMGNGPGGHPNMPNSASPPQQHPQQCHPQQRPPLQLTPHQRQAFENQVHRLTQQLLHQAAQKYGGNPAAIPQNERIACEQRAKIAAQEQMKKQFAVQQQRMREQQHQQMMQQHMAAMNGMGGMNGQGMQGMSGIGVQGMTEQQRNAMMQGMQQMHSLPHLGGSGIMHNNPQGMNGGGMGGMS